jgi:hypothetical protein
VVPDQSRLEPAALQLPPFEVIGGSRGPDLHSDNRRFFQYQYNLRLINEEMFGKDAHIPSVQVNYNLESRVGRGEAVAQMKADGVEYEQRMEELEKLEYPKPLRDFVYETFNAFADRHPWVGEENIRPKSIAREMFEGFRSFSDYVQEYDLERVEGLLLRHLHSVYKVLSQTVPDTVTGSVWPINSRPLFTTIIVPSGR